MYLAYTACYCYAHSFSPDSAIGKDLEALRSRCGYSYVELELTFKMDLYPFFPPTPRLVRPRFHGFMMGRIASMEIFQLSSWNSIRGMSVVLDGVRTGLETWAKLDVENPLNDMLLHPEVHCMIDCTTYTDQHSLYLEVQRLINYTMHALAVSSSKMRLASCLMSAFASVAACTHGSYTELEHQLMRLGLVTEQVPRPSLHHNALTCVLTAATAIQTAAATEKLCCYTRAALKYSEKIVVPLTAEELAMQAGAEADAKAECSSATAIAAAAAAAAALLLSVACKLLCTVEPHMCAAALFACDYQAEAAQERKRKR
eukprot:3407-Heterococcus_DN1.PRE.3